MCTHRDHNGPEQQNCHIIISRNYNSFASFSFLYVFVHSHISDLNSSRLLLGIVRLFFVRLVSFANNKILLNFALIILLNRCEQTGAAPQMSRFFCHAKKAKMTKIAIRLTPRKSQYTRIRFAIHIDDEFVTHFRAMMMIGKRNYVLVCFPFDSPRQ